MGRAPASLRARKGRESAAAKAERARLIFQRLHQTYSDAACALDHADAYQLLVATILSAQCTDARVNMVTPAFFARYPRPEDLARADRAEVEELIRSTGFFRNKARSLVGMARTSSLETRTESTRESRWTPTSPASRDCSVSPGTTTRYASSRTSCPSSRGRTGPCSPTS